MNIENQKWLKELGVGGIYVIHALKGYEEQENWVKNLFTENNLEFKFVTDGDPSRFTNELLSTYFTKHYLGYEPDGRISCTLNHILSYEKIVSSENKYALVFENDPFFLGSFKENLIHVVREADSLNPGFMISLENSTLKFPSPYKRKRGKYLYEADRGRLAGAYLMDNAAAKAIVEDLKTTKCNFTIDWWHNDLINRGIVKMYWAHPPLVEQCSHNGRMSSTISSKGSGWKRRIIWNIDKFYKRYILQWFRINKYAPKS